MDIKHKAPKVIQDLIERYKRNQSEYKGKGYNEFQLRNEFINPFFVALGWDVYNRGGAAPAYRDVILEDSIKIGVGTKAPDYCFTLSGRRMFFVETKKPSVVIKKDAKSAFQLRRYAWSSKLPLSILTNFEEFIIYESRQRPHVSDKPDVERILSIPFTKYIEKWEEIYNIFSFEAVKQGSFDRFAEEAKKKRGTQEVDDEFLKEIEEWREKLAKNIAIRNPDLSVRELNYSVQRTIDRIIFLRMSEDKGIEKFGQLQSIAEKEKIYGNLCEIFKKADEKYNSGLFHFKKERYRSTLPDQLTLKLAIDDNILKNIFRHLYYPNSPYEFSVISPEILGNVYEQFLGKIIRLTENHRAKIEEKPEVKKAGGVYYTPQYIVNYIVENTVGPLIKGKTPKQISDIKILDPACGSGSFLLGAYSKLLQYHLDYYSTRKNQKIYKDQIFKGKNGEWDLTIKEKKRILLNNIFGVDIDNQAVEVTKLSLLLKVLEGESKDIFEKQQKLWPERALPDLGDNIKCGNSLIGSDFYNGGIQTSLFDEDEMYRINAFDWNVEFKEILGDGGFDVVIGNPPYGFHQIHSDFVKPYFKEQFVSSHGSYEHYFIFYEKSLSLLKENGFHGFIVPVTWLTIPSALSLRKFILDDYCIREICWLPEFVFSNAKVNTLISVIQNKPKNKIKVKIYDELGFRKDPKEERTYNQSHFIDNDYYIGIFEKKEDSIILKKINKLSKPLKEFARPCSGYNPYEVGKGEAPEAGLQTKETVENKPYHSYKKLSKEWKPEIIGRNLGRYTVDITDKRWIKYGPWLAAPRDPNNFVGKRILVQEVTGGKDRRIIASYYDGELYHSRDVIPIKIEQDLPHPYYLLGIINSWLITWHHYKRNPKAKKGLFPKVLVSDLKKLPIYDIDFSNINDKIKHDKLIKLVEQILEFNNRIRKAKTNHEKTIINRQIKSLDRRVDNLVYELYGLNKKEIEVVEKTRTE